MIQTTENNLKGGNDVITYEVWKSKDIVYRYDWIQVYKLYYYDCYAISVCANTKCLLFSFLKLTGFFHAARIDNSQIIQVS